MNSDIRVNYEELVENYHKNLFESLRGFRPTEFLDMWVPDEDHEKSILNLVESAQLAGLDNITVFVDSSMVHLIDFSRLQDQTSEIGETKLKPSDEGMDLEVSKMKYQK